MRSISFARALLICAIMPSQALASGAVAIGQPDDVARGGLAIGWAAKQATREEADAAALNECREYKDAPEATRNLCRLIGHFDHRCLALVIDPRPGTYGFGWAISDTQQEADDIAMMNCRATAREEAAACVSSLRKCDD